MLRQRMMRVLERDPFIQSIARPGVPIADVEYFAYVADFAAMAEGASATQTIETASDSDFVLVMQNGSSYGPLGSSGQSLIYATATIAEGQGNNPFFSQAAPFQQVFGYEGAPFILPKPRVFRPNSRIKVTINFIDINGGQNQSFRCAFHGMRLYYSDIDNG